MRIRRAAGAAAVASALLLAPAAHAASPTYTVDDDHAQCPQAQYTTITAAVTAAPAGATVKVCPGTYTESVPVAKPVDLEGVRKGAPDPAQPADPSREATVVNAGQGAFQVTADHVTIDGFRIQGAGITDAVYPGAGIELKQGADRTISDNLVVANGIGVHLNGSENGLDITRNVFYGNSRGPNPNFIPTGAMFNDAGALDDTDIDFNQFSNNDQFDINIGGGSNHGLDIDHNASHRDDTFLVIGNTAGADVDHNAGDQMSGNLVYEFGGNRGLAIDHNDASGVPGVSGTGILQVDATFGATENDTGTQISHNDITKFFNGVRLASAQDANVFENDLNGNDANGLRLGGGAGVTGAQIVNNDTQGNGENGILADSNSSGNRIERNQSSGNTAFDCRDDSTGSGTAGTANFWIQDMGDTQNRPGICKSNRGKH
jgi:nitrous oxidase accessory protein NosD